MRQITYKPKKLSDVDIKYNLKLYFSFLKNYKFYAFFLAGVVLLLALINTVDKFLFKKIIDGGSAYAVGQLSKDAFIQVLFFVAVIFVVIYLIKSISKWLLYHLVNRLDVWLTFDLKKRFFEHILGLSYKFHTTHKTGSLISRLSRGGRAIENLTDVFVFNMLPLLFQTILVGALIFYFDKTSALIIFLMAVVFLAYSLFLQQKQRKANAIANDSEDFEKAYIADTFTNFDSIKYFGKEKFSREKFSEFAERTKKTTLFSWDFYRWIDSGQVFIIATGTFFLMYHTISNFLDGKITIGTLVLIYGIYGNLLDPLYSFVNGVRNFFRAMVDLDPLFSYAKIENEVKDLPHSIKADIKKGEIVFHDVSFKYDKRKIFTNFSLKIPKNKKVAFVGHSGSGKTTLVKLLYRLYDVDSGKIIIDGEDIRSFKQESLREEMSIVPQECILFDDSVYNNVAFSKPNASREEVMNAMRFAELDKVIKDFPNKEDAIVGERGIKLSGGEKQRVSIARAILANKKILVLDEATSALDSETEYEIQANFEKLMKGRTTIIIAHRLSTIMKADLIVVLKRGTIVQMGTHKELIKKKGEYKTLWGLQKGGYIK